jgi:type IV pilus assembly protein PilP
MQDLRDYLADVKSREKGRIEPLPEIKQIETYVYAAGDRRDPFSPSVSGSTEVAQVLQNGLAPDPLRRKEELEGFPLDSIRMVGTLEQKDSIWGLVTTADGTIFRVKPGNYMGQNNGQITRVSEEQIELTEIVSDGQGGYRERLASLAVNE